MLKQRVITALVLLALLLPAMLAENSAWFDGLTLILMAAGAWEWGRLQGMPHRSAVVSGALIGALLLFSRWAPHATPAPQSVAWLGALIWVPGMYWMVKHGLQRWGQLAAVWRLSLGWLAVAVAWWSLVAVKAQGLNFLLSVLTLVWAADIAAYFGGRAWGRRKLAPQISPGKTWAGAISGAVAVLCLGLLWVWFDARTPQASPSLYTMLWLRAPWWCLVAGAILVAFSIMGDLVESLVKRVAGVKDSSQLLPGHGGVLDRVDALLPVLPMSLWMTWW